MALLETFVAEPPLRADESGTVRVGQTRVTLDTVIYHYNQDREPEDILRKYPSLKLADIYGAIRYSLLHRAEVDAYLKERKHVAEELRIENEKRFPKDAVRARLLARRGQQEE